MRIRQIGGWRRVVQAAVVVVVVGTAAVAACGSGDNKDASTTVPSSVAGDAAFPVTVPHAFGETEVPEPPQRVLTWGWGSADAAIALGVVPVAMPHQAYGGDDEGVLPWVREALEERNLDMPTILPDAEEPPFEAIAAARPDLILAVYSGITDSDYKLLSDIAPTIAYPDEAWATPWEETIRIVGTALGRADEADALLQDIDRQVAEAAAAHPELAGKSVAMVWDASDAFYVYKPADARVAFTLDLGLVNAPSVDALANGDETFYFTLSHERLGELKSDILVSYADTQEQSKAFLSSSRAQLMEQVKRGTVAEVIGTEFIASVSPPTALSLTWGLDEYVEILSGAAKAADAAS
jgi:iron complex transport system substrate-binding protein